MCVCVCVCVRACVCVYLCIFVFMYFCIYVFMYVCMYVSDSNKSVEDIACTISCRCYIMYTLPGMIKLPDMYVSTSRVGFIVTPTTL